MSNIFRKFSFQMFINGTIVTLFSCLVCSSMAHAANPSIKEAVIACANISNSLERLVCYDRLSADVNNFAEQALRTVISPTVREVTAPKPATPKPSVTKPIATDADTFGKTVKTDDSMTGTIASIKTGRNNMLTITLENGQVWQQTKSEDRARLKAQQVVTLEKGFFGSIYLTAEGSNRRVAVKRLK